MSGNFEEKNVEYKKGYSDKICRAVLAFANTNGGKIYVGIDDFGSVVGLARREEVKSQIDALLRKSVCPNVTPYVEYTNETAEGKEILGIEVTRGTGRPYWLAEKGLEPDGVLVREGGTNAPATWRRIREIISETSESNYESRRALEQNLSFQYMSRVMQDRKTQFTPEDLASYGLVDSSGAYTNLARMLSDQQTPLVRLIVVSDDLEPLDILEPTGSLLSQFARTLELLDQRNRKLAKTISGKFVDGAEYREFPPEAIQAAVVNAFAHRDYSIDSPTLVRLYSNRLEIVSYGGFVEPIDPSETTFGIAATRNPKLTSLLHRLGVFEGCGLGFAKMRRSYREYQPNPEVEASKNFVKTTLYKVFEQKKASLSSNSDDVRMARYTPLKFSVSTPQESFSETLATDEIRFERRPEETPGWRR